MFHMRRKSSHPFQSFNEILLNFFEFYFSRPSCLEDKNFNAKRGVCHACI